MAKAFEFLADLEYLMLAIILVAVLYLVWAQLDLKVSMKEKFAGNHGIRFLTEDTATNRASSSPYERGYEGMSTSANEPPVHWATPYDSTEMNQARELSSEPREGMRRAGYSRAAVESMDNKLTDALAGGNAALQ
jgi:hypothetical protein